MIRWEAKIWGFLKYALCRKTQLEGGCVSWYAYLWKSNQGAMSTVIENGKNFPLVKKNYHMHNPTTQDIDLSITIVGTP